MEAEKGHVTLSYVACLGCPSVRKIVLLILYM